MNGHTATQPALAGGNYNGGEKSRTAHTPIEEFATGVQRMADLEQQGKIEVGGLVKELVVALQSQARTRPHPLLYVNLGLVLTLSFWSGVQWQRVNTIEVSVTRYAGVETLATQILDLKNEMGRMRDRFERWADRNNMPPAPNGK